MGSRRFKIINSSIEKTTIIKIRQCIVESVGIRRFLKGMVKFESGYKQAAIIEYNRAIIFHPELVPAYVNRGITKYGLGQYQEAIADYSRAIAIDPDATSYNNRGLAKAELGKKQSAMNDFNRAIKIDPSFTQAYINRGKLKSSLGQKQAGIEDITRAAELFHHHQQMDLYESAIRLIWQIRG